MEYTTLSNGVKMPMLGYGVYKIEPQECVRCVQDAIGAGNRLIDTAQFYKNEEAVGEAIKKSAVPREEFFIVDKVWITNSGYIRAKTSIEESLLKLQTPYIDLLLIHKPAGDYFGIYRAMEEAYREGKVRAIGVSSFNEKELREIYEFAEIKPMVNQVETHVFYQRKKLHECMEELGVKHMSWAPFAEGKRNIFENPVLTEIGKKHMKSSSQVCLRYMLQSDIILIPKSTHIERMKQNLDIFDFELDREDMEKLRELNEEKGISPVEISGFTGGLYYFFFKAKEFFNK
ncbi:aldo/keto reductase [Butyrivibrio sp. X503]|uniref:aldo/keto reductase n=1 Tax=Butyrivibrio sp. X503 TaxID=2364878 RepID=UPI000EAA5E4A|nr:aldo/keto reductase [Butyrivibrio sp. X503]RKM58444.1 aldo/keto reductase [Butyrivibrio sp. X503]